MGSTKSDFIPLSVESGEKVDGLDKHSNGQAISASFVKPLPANQQKKEKSDMEAPLIGSDSGSDGKKSLGEQMEGNDGKASEIRINMPPTYEIEDEIENPKLDNMINVAIGVVTVGTGGTYGFLQASPVHTKDHIQNLFHFACNTLFCMASLLAALLILIIYIGKPKCPRDVMILRYSLRVALALVAAGYILAVAFILQRG